MTTVTASDARKLLFPLLGQVNDDHSVVTISSKAGNAVLMSEGDYEAWQTTLHLFLLPPTHTDCPRPSSDLTLAHTQRGSSTAREAGFRPSRLGRLPMVADQRPTLAQTNQPPHR